MNLKIDYGREADYGYVTINGRPGQLGELNIRKAFLIIRAVQRWQLLLRELPNCRDIL